MDSRRKRSLIRTPSPALVVACIALAVALSGTGYAVVNLPRNSVGTAQLKTDAVNSAKVRDRSLKAGDFALGQLPAVAGPSGPPGPAGPPGSPLGSPLPPADFWRSLRPPGTPVSAGLATFNNCWANYYPTATFNLPFNPAGFYKDHLGAVHLRGVVSHLCAESDGAGTTIFTLPEGYRPPVTVRHFTLANDTMSRVDILPTGEVIASLPVGSTPAQYLSLFGVGFMREPTTQNDSPP